MSKFQVCQKHSVLQGYEIRLNKLGLNGTCTAHACLWLRRHSATLTKAKAHLSESYQIKLGLRNKTTSVSLGLYNNYLPQ